MHPGWRDQWQRSLVFPATGKNRATVDDEDIPRLDEGEFLNDNLISFYIRYLQVALERDSPEVLQKVHIFSTFFFEKLRSTKGKINYDGVKAWTAKIDLFSYDYIIVPVNEHAHWYLAIICNVSSTIKGIPEDDDVQMIDEPQKPRDRDAQSTPPPSSRTIQASPGGKRLDPRQPRVVTLDSLESPHSPTCRALKEYLAEEAKNKKNVDLVLPPSGMSAKKIPCQNNYCDCGVYVLGYLREFLKNPDEVARKLLQREDLGWDIQPSQIRNDVRETLFDLQQSQTQRFEQEKREKRASIAMRKAAKRDSQQVAKVDDLPPTVTPPKGQSAGTDMAAPAATRNSQPKLGNAETTDSHGDQTPGPRETVEHDLPLIDKLRSSSSSSSSSGAFYSAAESPNGLMANTTRRPKQAADEDKEQAQASKPETVKVDDDMQLIETLPSSEEDNDRPHVVSDQRVKRVRPSSVEIVRKQPKQTYGSTSRRKQTSEISSFFPSQHPKPSKATVKSKRREGYDGIEHPPVDLTDDA
ncbi:sentrin-specific protease [Purpureocillium lavendulum]|uniref:Sentrin-specific protease n=1 Tax=Purpureocillium lavendulum TaxID=1247861 RepID=A0AB34FH13_9HYPO|nr:sentrin-specific protease [Purpureocillium lavendulum]